LLAGSNETRGEGKEGGAGLKKKIALGFAKTAPKEGHPLPADKKGGEKGKEGTSNFQEWKEKRPAEGAKKKITTASLGKGKELSGECREGEGQQNKKEKKAPLLLLRVEKSLHHRRVLREKKKKKKKGGSSNKKKNSPACLRASAAWEKKKPETIGMTQKEGGLRYEKGKKVVTKEGLFFGGFLFVGFFCCGAKKRGTSLCQKKKKELFILHEREKKSPVAG